MPVLPSGMTLIADAGSVVSVPLTTDPPFTFIVPAFASGDAIVLDFRLRMPALTIEPAPVTTLLVAENTPPLRIAIVVLTVSVREAIASVCAPDPPPTTMRDAVN